MPNIALPRRYSPKQLKQIASFTKAQKEQLAGLTIRKTLRRTMASELDELAQRIVDLVSSPGFEIKL